MGILWFIKSSVSLDRQFIQVSSWSVAKKLEFLAKKYIEIVLNLTKLKKFRPAKSKISLFGTDIYYDTSYGLAGYQSMLARHQKMLKAANLRDVATVLDIGANVGFFSLLARDLYPNATIYAIEPLPEVYVCLEKNLTGIKDRLFNIAISDKSGFEYMHVGESSAFSAITKTPQPADIKVPAITLDEFCIQQAITRIDLLKIDTESFEANVLMSAKETLSKTKYLHIEISIENNNNYTFSQINSLLYSDAFNFQLINFRNFTDKGSGPIPVGDFFYVNKDFLK